MRRSLPLLGAGVAFLLRSPERPDTRWPWRRDGEFWTLRYDPPGPRDCFAEPSAMLASYEPGISVASRRSIVILATIFVIADPRARRLLRGKNAADCDHRRRHRLTACRDPPRGRTRGIQPSAPTHRRRGGPFGDHFRSVAAGFLVVSSRPASGRGSNERRRSSDARRLSECRCRMGTDAALAGQRTGKIPLFEYQTSPGMKVAFLSRLVMPRGNAVFPANNLHNSPLRLVTDETYLKNGAHIIGEGSGSPIVRHRPKASWLSGDTSSTTGRR